MTEHERADYDRLYRSGREVRQLHAGRAAKLLQANTARVLLGDRRQ
jgi:hypothetical protein